MPTLTLNGTELELGKDYKLIYKKNKKVGRATVTATGVGNYGETVSTYFNIVKNKLVVQHKGNDTTISMEGTGWATVPRSCYESGKGTKNNRKTIKFKKGKYIVPRVALDSYTTVQGTGATFKPSSTGFFVAGEGASRPGGYNHFTNVTIKGGNYLSSPACTGSIMKFSHGQKLKLSDFRMNNCNGGHFIEFVGMRNSTINKVKLTGKYSGASDNEAIQLDNASSDEGNPNVSTHAPYCEPFDGTPCANITISGCKINVPTIPFGVGTCFYHTKLSTKIVIKNCFIKTKTAATKLHATDYCTVVGNTFSGVDLGRVETANHFTEYGNKRTN